MSGMDIDRAREIDDARRIDEMYEEGAKPIKVLRQKCYMNSDLTIELLIESGLFYGITKEAQNASANHVAEYLWALIQFQEEGNHKKFAEYSTELMRNLVTKMEVSI